MFELYSQDKRMFDFNHYGGVEDGIYCLTFSVDLKKEVARTGLFDVERIGHAVQGNIPRAIGVDRQCFTDNSTLNIARPTFGDLLNRIAFEDNFDATVGRE
jgi:hypothetical protein